MTYDADKKPPRDLFYYLATPYSCYLGGRHQAFTEAATIVGKLFSAGYHVFSPIVHCHCVKSLVLLPDSYEFWLGLDFKFIERADALMVATLPGWDNSEGVGLEVDRAKSTAKPVFYIDPITLREVEV